MTALDTTTSLEQAIEEALSPESPCEGYAPCGNTPTWWGINPCSCRSRCCNSCRIRAVAAYLQRAQLGWLVGCSICGARDQDPLSIRWEPIR